MSMRSGLTAILSIGIAYSLMVGVSGCSSDDASEEVLSDDQPRSESSIDQSVSQPTTLSLDDPDEYIGMTEDRLVSMFADAGYSAQHLSDLDAYVDTIAKGQVLFVQFAADAPSTVYYGLSKGSEAERLEEIYADFEEWKVETVVSMNEYYQKDPWFSEYWTVTGVVAVMNTYDLDAPYPDNIHYYLSTPEGIETIDESMTRMTVYDYLESGVTTTHTSKEQWCMNRTDSEGTDYLRSTDYVEGYGVVDIAYYDYGGGDWFVADDGQIIIWTSERGWYVPDWFIDWPAWLGGHVN